MDHSMYVFASNGVPQESKLATYMNRQNTSTPVATNTITQSFAKVTLGSPVNSKKVTPQSPEFVPSARINTTNSSASPNFFNSFPGLSGTTTGPGYQRTVAESPHSGTISPHLTPQPSPPLTANNCSPIPHVPIEKPAVTVAAYQENVGGTTYFYPTSAENSVTTNDTLSSVNSSVGSSYQVYPGTPSHVTALKSKTGSSSFFIAEDTRMDILNRNALTLLQPDPGQFPDLPQDVDNYHELCPLEPIPTNSLQKALIGYQASMYKATHIKTGTRHCLRRIHGTSLRQCDRKLNANVFISRLHFSLYTVCKVIGCLILVLNQGCQVWYRFSINCPFSAYFFHGMKTLLL
uniref:Uncharacterized protein n=1 Tax=Photinus pyralis TaxID=7054 RepID=A0A1Y1L4R9_PHOPY